MYIRRTLIDCLTYKGPAYVSGRSLHKKYPYREEPVLLVRVLLTVYVGGA